MSNKNIVRVKDVMKKSFVLMDGLSTVEEAINIMLKENEDAVFISRRNDNDEFGIVVLRDIAQKVLASNKSPERINLYEIMTKPVMGVDPEMNVRYCARVFSRFGLATAPVIKDDEIQGVITYKELVLKNYFTGSS
jgi:predicted transcriptional regulator